jgi:hypothetical protein
MPLPPPPPPMSPSQLVMMVMVMMIVMVLVSSLMPAQRRGVWEARLVQVVWPVVPTPLLCEADREGAAAEEVGSTPAQQSQPHRPLGLKSKREPLLILLHLLMLGASLLLILLLLL